MLRTGGSGHSVFVMVSEYYNLSRLINFAARAVMTLGALLGAVRDLCFVPVAIVVTKFINIGVNITVRATGTSMRRVALFCASGGSDGRCVGMVAYCGIVELDGIYDALT